MKPRTLPQIGGKKDLRSAGGVLGVRPVRIGETGIQKSIHLGLGTGDEAVDFIAGFLATSRQTSA